MPSWMYFVLALAGLLAGYCVYGAIVEKVFGPDPNRPTPACKMPDGVDYVEMSPSKVFLIQLLNIAGLGPIFGALSGALRADPWCPLRSHSSPVGRNRMRVRRCRT